jgi:NADH-quinone oxidoreductase subunit M
MLLTILIFVPAVAAAVLALSRALAPYAVRWVWLGVSVGEVLAVALLWIAYARGAGRTGADPVAFEVSRAWVPGAGSGWHVGVDGLSLPLLSLTTVVFAACAVYSWREAERPRHFAALFLALESTCLGLFAALDLIVFFLFFDLSIVGMYFVIALWGHGASRRDSALKFFLYTFAGSLGLLLGFIGLYSASDPHTFDMVALTRNPPLAGGGAGGVLVLIAIALGLAIKTPVFPFHTWLPPAHTDAPAAGSAVLAGVLLKMGAYGFVRIAMPILPEAWRQLAWVFVILGVVSVLWGALVALGQTSFKRMVAYTSVNHMGYVVLALGAAGLLGGTDSAARSVAVTGAIVQMVSHGLITSALFLLAGSLFDRGGSYEMDHYGGLASSLPRFATLTVVASFASLGIPGFSGFIAEFQIFAGSLPSATVPTAIATIGILITAGLFLWAIHRLLLGEQHGPSMGRDLAVREWLPATGLLAAAFAVGVYPRLILAVIEPAARVAADLVAR